MGSQKHLVVSAVNFNEGGPLTVLQECLETAAKYLPADWKITALVHCKGLISHPRIETLYFPNSKRSWLIRLWLEWVTFGQLSKKLSPDLWLSLHDITPRVLARRQAVYCHNPSPFHKLTLRDAWLDPGFGLFNLLYSTLYGLFLSRNYAVVVQQAWIRDVFRGLYNHPRVVVAYPEQSDISRNVIVRKISLGPFNSSRPLLLLYPALPRVFKNVEVLCEAFKRLPSALTDAVELRLTMCGTENAYARDLYRRFSLVPGIHFIGRQSRQRMEREYSCCDVVLFPSRLETWGLPITEAKAWGKPLVVADLPYARETVGTYDAVTFLPAEDADAWTFAIEQIITGQHSFGQNKSVAPEEPFAADWFHLWRFLAHEL